MSRTSIRGVVFDLDATLVDLGEHVRWREAQGEVTEAYRACGCSDEDLKRCGSRGLFNLMHEMDTLLASSKSKSELKAIQERIWGILDCYEKEGTERCGFMPGTEEVLDWLRTHDISLGVCTSNSTEVSMLVLEKLSVDSFFASVIGRTPGLRMKPYPDQVLACLREMGVEPRDGLMVGDSHNDVLAGKAAGARAIAIPVYFTRKDALETAKPDVVIKSMSELPEAILALR